MDMPYIRPPKNKNTKPSAMIAIRTTFIAALLLLSAVSNAQTKTNKAQVKWGQDMTIKEDGLFDDVIGDVDNSVFLLIHRKKEAFIQRMDGLKTAWQKPIDLKLDKKDIDLHKIIITESRILVFATHYDKSANENDLYVSTYDQEGFKQVKRLEKISSIPATKSSNVGAFNISASPDRSKVLVQAMPPFDKKEAEKSRMEVYDDNMQLQWSQDYVLPFTDSEFKLESQTVDNDGSVLVVGVKYAEKQEKRQLKRANKATYEYHMLVYTGDSPTAQDNLITVADKFLQDMTISMGNEGDIICAGLYGNKNSFNVRGAFYLRLDRASKAIVHQSYKEFSDDFITSYMTEKQAAKAKKKAAKKDGEVELPEFFLHDLIRRDDGGAVLVAEQFRTYTVCTTDSKGNTYCSTHYVYNDVILVNINPQGDIEWASKVPKRQHSVNDLGRYSGCAVEVKKDKIYIIFNDSGENLFLKPGDKVKQFELTGKDALVVLATVDGEGHTTREALFSPERRDVILRPQDCVEMRNESMFIYANRKKDYRYGLIDFK